MPNEQWAPLNLAKVTATPSDAQESSIWYRTDLDQVHGSDGGAGLPLMLGPVGNLPVIRSTAWHTLPPFGPQDVEALRSQFGVRFLVIDRTLVPGCPALAASQSAWQSFLEILTTRSMAKSG